MANGLTRHPFGVSEAFPHLPPLPSSIGTTFILDEQLEQHRRGGIQHGPTTVVRSIVTKRAHLLPYKALQLAEQGL